MQLRNSVDISACLINGVKFHLVVLKEERIFTPNGSILLNKLEDKLSAHPIIFVSGRLKQSSMAMVRQRKLGYIVPGEFCFIPAFLLQHTKQEEKAINNDPLSIFATTIVMQYLDSMISEECLATDIKLFGSKMSKSRAISELEERNIIEVSKSGRSNHILFLKSKLELWSVRKKLLSPICTKKLIVNKKLVHLNTIIFGGETALAVYSLLTPPKRECVIANETIAELLDESDIITDEENWDDEQLVDLHVYPMSVKVDRIRDRLYISPITLALSNLKPTDERAHSSYMELEDQITKSLQNNISLT